MSRKRLYLLCPALIALIASALFATPGCSADSCQGASSKICSKACACGSDCVVNGLKLHPETGCSVTLGSMCDPTKHDVDWAACSTALDTAQCSNGAPVVPSECGGTAGTGGSGSTGSASATTSGSTSGSTSSGGG